MPTEPIVDFTKINIENTQFDREEIKQTIPHRHEMLQIDRIVCFNPEQGFSVGVKEVREDEFWVRGHIPGRPILPGVLLLEASAQLGFFHFRKAVDPDPNKFFGFAKIDKVKYRGIAQPGEMLVLAAKLLNTRRNTATFAVQNYIDGNLIFEAEIFGATV